MNAVSISMRRPYSRSNVIAAMNRREFARAVRLHLDVLRLYERLLWSPVVPAACALFSGYRLATAGPNTTRVIGFGVVVVWLALAVHDRRRGGRLSRTLVPGPRPFPSDDERRSAAAKRELPVLAMLAGPLLPEESTTVAIRSPANMKAVLDAISTDRTILVLALRTTDRVAESSSDFATTGCVARVGKVRASGRESGAALDVCGLARARVLGMRNVGTHWTAAIESVVESVDRDSKVDEAHSRLRAAAHRMLRASGTVTSREIDAYLTSATLGMCTDFVAGHLGLADTLLQHLLETTSPAQRAELLLDATRLQFDDAKAIDERAQARYDARRLLHP
jgi:hypothetical protein